mmetsp:Transcript_24899/g.45078  ORF Transcript_24899/g.45078 Transcript_24899/m.45078 type:complete len:426 (-) Transcript_24899:123-1400(-)
MHVPSPPGPADSADPPPPSLSPISDGSVADSGNPSPPTMSPDSDRSVLAYAGGKNPRDVIFEAFGGERKFKRPFPPHKPYGAEFTVHRHALMRVAKKLPPHLSPEECLSFWGLEKNEATAGVFFLAENYKLILEGRMIKSTLGKKWVDSVYAGGGIQKVAGEELNEGICDGEFQGVSLRYFPVQEEIVDGIWNGNDGEKEFVNHIGTAINEWLSSRPPPQGHTRFFHGTSALAMTDIVDTGVGPSQFNYVADFGPGFYCGDKVHTTLRFANASALLAEPLADAEEGPHGARFRAAVIYFDVNDKDFDDLEKLDLDEGDEWSQFTKQCITRNGYKQVYKVGSERENLELVVGKLVHNLDGVESSQDEPEAFVDQRRQFAFRKDTAWDLLLADKTKIGVALYDIHLGPNAESNIPDAQGIHLSLPCS